MNAAFHGEAGHSEKLEVRNTPWNIPIFRLEILLFSGECLSRHMGLLGKNCLQSKKRTDHAIWQQRRFPFNFAWTFQLQPVVVSAAKRHLGSSGCDRLELGTVSTLFQEPSRRCWPSTRRTSPELQPRVGRTRPSGHSRSDFGYHAPKKPGFQNHGQFRVPRTQKSVSQINILTNNFESEEGRPAKGERL